jgi:hypothetical protein
MTTDNNVAELQNVKEQTEKVEKLQDAHVTQTVGRSYAVNMEKYELERKEFRKKCIYFSPF